MQLVRGINMAGLNTKSGQRNAPSPYSANASKAPVPKQNPGGGTTLENRNNPQFLKPKPGTSEISAKIPVEPIDEMRRREKEDFDYYSQFVQQNRGQAARDNSSFKSQDANTNTQAAAAQTAGQMDMAKFQADQTAKGNYSAAINQIRTANIDRDAANAQNQAAADRQREEIGYRKGKDLQDYYADVQKSQLGYASSAVQTRAATRANQNYQYWG